MFSEQSLAHSQLIRYSTRAKHLQRPQCKPTDFWYISQKAWNDLILAAANDDAFNQPMKELRKFDNARQIMETDSGTLAIFACGECKKKKVTCVIWAEGGKKMCAYCTRYSRGGCDASMNAPPATTEDTVEDHEGRLATIENEVESFASAGRVDGVEDRVQGLENRISTVEKAKNLGLASVPVASDGASTQRMAILEKRIRDLEAEVCVMKQYEGALQEEIEDGKDRLRVVKKEGEETLKGLNELKKEMEKITMALKFRS